MVVMFIRPGNLNKTFFVEKKTESIDEDTARAVAKYDIDNAVMIRAVLAQASTSEKERWQQLQHPITHTIVQYGKPKAVEGDRLVHNNRTFYVQGVDEPGELGVATIYYAEERSDTNAN